MLRESPMDHANTISKLRDIHMPSDFESVTPIIISMLGCICALIIFRSIIYYNSLYPVRIKALKSLKDSRVLIPNERLIAQSRLLREVAQSVDKETSFLYGEAWLEQLDRIFKTNFFSKGEGKIFGTELYQKDIDLNIAPLDSALENLLMALPK